MRVIAVVQARMGSSRLPGKVLLDLDGLPVLGWVLRALEAARGVDAIVVATSTLPGDDPIERYAAEVGVSCVRGSEDDVLARFAMALECHPADAVVRLTADCPLLDPALIDQVVSRLAGRSVLGLRRDDTPSHPAPRPRCRAGVCSRPA
ncbi:MAG: NTP transferase domain-containing protein [Nocardioidaceae bacterium]